jgi:hypothetical protein
VHLRREHRRSDIEARALFERSVEGGLGSNAENRARGQIIVKKTSPVVSCQPFQIVSVRASSIERCANGSIERPLPDVIDLLVHRSRQRHHRHGDAEKIVLNQLALFNPGFRQR